MAWKDAIGKAARGTLGNAEELADIAWRRLSRKLGYGEPRHIAAYHGYGNSNHVWVRGRLLANPLYGGPKEDDNWWDNLVASYQRWQSNEIPGAPVTLSYAGLTQTVITDKEGYYVADFALSEAARPADAVVATHESQERTLTALHRVTHLHEDADFMLISDVDDTIIHTHLTDLLLAAQLTFLNNARTRKPLTGAAGLYRALSASVDGVGRNPVFYLSNSGWNMYDLLRDFIDLNDFPEGPLLLRDLSLTNEGQNHKVETLHALLDRFEHLPVVLVGDSGQHDAETYARIAETHAGRIKAVYIRDVDPHSDSEHDLKVDRILERADLDGVPFLRVGDSAEIARHAAELGLLDSAAVAAVEAEAGRDRSRQEL